MKHLMVTSIILLAGISGEAMAIDCSGGTQLKNTGSNPNVVANAISGKTVCAAIPPNQQWQEYHQLNGDLIDYKKGPNNPIDKSAKVGTWSTSGIGSSSVVTYNYGSGGSYSYKIHLSGSQYTFCGTSPVPTLDVALLSNQVSCPPQ